MGTSIISPWRGEVLSASLAFSSPAGRLGSRGAGAGAGAVSAAESAGERRPNARTRVASRRTKPPRGRAGATLADEKQESQQTGNESGPARAASGAASASPAA